MVKKTSLARVIIWWVEKGSTFAAVTTPEEYPGKERLAAETIGNPAIEDSFFESLASCRSKKSSEYDDFQL